MQSDYKPMANFENLFQRLKQRRQLLNRDEYYGDFSGLVYDEIYMNLYSLPIYNVYERLKKRVN